ncbi:hypothetical protein [Clostridium estertheticum]|uniref:hypothetical protein n=1 Tax=Clostridium estertheticum TaxID=238834 RepID=UPI001C0D2BFD|nr:hypothetical protein [Clostridium estertheticum]MBU3174305.1 hypothetical protein [Clostridium estertheticum]
MDRTYNVYIDNGLFVVANLLNIKIENITIENLKENTGLFADKIYEFITCNKYSQIGGMSFFNSAYSQPAFRNNRKEKIKEQYDIIMSNTGEDEYCCLCGKKHIKYNKDKEYIKKLNRAFIINGVADSFYNHSNNLQTINVCPSCILLGMLSTLNMRKSGYIVLYNSESDDFMYDLTNERQIQNLNDIVSDLKFDDKAKNTVNLQDEILHFILEKTIHKNNLKVYKFSNGKTEFYDEKFLKTSDLELFNDIYVEDLLHEFNEYYLFNNLLQGNLKYIYTSKLIDFKKDELKCSKELIKFLEGRLNRLSKELNEIIKKISEGISDINNKDCLLELKSVSSYNKFIELILRWVEIYKNKQEKDLITSEEFDLLTNRMKYVSIKNKMIFELILNK